MGKFAHLWLAATLFTAIGCSKKSPEPGKSAPGSESPGETPAATGGEPSAATDRQSGDAPPPDEAGIDWIHDDFPGAANTARERSQPLFVDMWAPWCHTCLSMKHYIFTDRALAPFARRFAWVAIDTDRAENAAALEQLPVGSWPTFYVLASDGKTVLARHEGAASVAQMRELLRAADEAELGKREIDPKSPLGLVQAGDRAAAGRDHAAAADAYWQALEAAPADWPRAADVAVKWVASVARGKEWTQCTERAEKALAWAIRGNTVSAGDFSYFAGVCAGKVEDEGAQKKLYRALAQTLGEVLAQKSHGLSLDDRSDALRIQRTMFDALGEEKAAREAATAQRTLLVKAIEHAPNAHVAMTYNWPFAEVHVYLDSGKDALATLEKSVADLPTEYDPPHRLAWVLYKLGEHDRALPHAERAAELAYGPRKARILGLVADIHNARGNTELEKQARTEIVDLYEKLPKGQANESRLEQAKKALRELSEKS